MPSFVSPSNMKLLHLVVYRMHWSRMSVVSLLHAFVNVFEPVIPSGTLILVIEQLNSNKEADQRFPVNCKSASALLVKELSYLRASPTWSSKTYPAKSPEEYQRYQVFWTSLQFNLDRGAMICRSEIVSLVPRFICYLLLVLLVIGMTVTLAFTVV